jgi:HD superfamily phosphohydrolase
MEEPEAEQLYLRLVNTYEMNRLNYLKQAGLLFLIFPSATHTRFAHSLGTFILGTYALEHIWVLHTDKKTKIDGAIKLEDYLKQKSIREEFLFALLLHDIGHLPFSHHLESNKFIKQAYGNHEKIALDMLNPRSKLYEKLKKEADKQGVETILDICKDFKSSIDVEKIIKLMDEDNNNPISQLVCGYIDLDRLDHYYRDSFFIGSKLASVNVKGFLDDVIIDDRRETPKILLREDGIQHVLNLLFGKEMLWQYALERDDRRAYQAMFVRAVDKWIEQTPSVIDDIPFMTDDVLTSQLLSCDASSKLMLRVFSKKPYLTVIKERTHLNEKEFIKVFHDWQEEEGLDEDEVLFFLAPNFQNKGSIAREWLLSDIPIYNPDPNILHKCLKDTHSSLFNYFVEQMQVRISTVRVFSLNELPEDKINRLTRQLR